MNKIRSILFLIVAILTVLSMFSCGNKNNVDGNEKNESCVWGEGVAPSILLDSYAKENLDSQYWLNKFYEITGKVATVIPESNAAASHEIIVGRLDKALSEKAYTHLERLLEEDENRDSVGYLIYSDGKSVAIAYSDQFSFNEAIRYFNGELLTKSTFAPKEGVVYESAFKVSEYLDASREARRERELDALVPEVGEETVLALKNLFSLYTDGLYKWTVDLYDGEIGGFYACNSGRDTEGFLPDIQSTWQILSFYSKSGLTSGYKSIREAVPEEIGNKILEYAKSLQSSENGYFYHPQWGDDITTARLGRDLAWATETISMFGGRPLYDTPNGVKGSLGAPGHNKATSHLADRISTSHVTAVSKIVSVSKSSLPAYLKSLDAWDSYIKGLNIPYNSYNAGNTLASQHGQIKLAGQEYVDHLIDYLNSIKNPKTALWEAENSENDEYYAVNGLMKLSSLYNAFQKPLPDAEAAIESCMAVILKPDGDTYVCSVYNPWITMYYVLLSAERTEGEERASELRSTILPRAAELIEATTKKIADYRLTDGAFATYGRDAAPINMLTGAIVGCATTPESDVDAATISSVGIVCNIFNVLGCTEVKLYDENDYLALRERWLTLGDIVKRPYLNNIVPSTFDDYDPDYHNIDSGVIFDPDDNVQNVVGDTESNGANYKWFASAIVKDPASSEEGDLALRTETFLDNGATKPKADGVSSTYFGIQGVVRKENCFIFDTDIYFERTEGSTCVGEIYFTTSMNRGDSAFGITVLKYTANGKTYFSIGEAFEGLDGKRDNKVVSGIPSGEWVRLRLELYRTYTDDSLDIKCKIYINGKYKGTCDAGYVINGQFADRKVAAVRYAHYRYAASVTYFDNTSVYAINKEYVPEDDYTGEDSGPKKIDFEDYMTYGDTTYVHAPTPVSPDASFGVSSVIGADGKETNAYVYDSNKGGQDTFRLQSYGLDLDAKLTAANAFTYDADMKLDFNTEEPNGEIIVRIGSTSTSYYHAYYMLMSLDKSGKIAIKDVGAAYSGSTVITEATNGAWFNLRVEYYYISYSEMLVLTYVNNKLVYVSNNYSCKNAKDSDVWPVFDADGYTLPSDKTIGGIEKFMFTIPSSTDVTVYLDNCIIRRCELTPPAVKDYTSRFDKDLSGTVSGDATPPSGDVSGNLPDGNWKD